MSSPAVPIQRLLVPAAVITALAPALVPSGERAAMAATSVSTPATSSSPSLTSKPAPQTAAQLFDTTTVWTIHFTFAPDQWKAMEPKNVGGPFGGGGPGGLGGTGGRPGGDVRFGPSMFIAPVFLKDGDQDHDGKLTREEFHALAEKWFGAWDKDKAGKLTGEQLRAGINVSFAPPNFGPPGGGGGPPGGGPPPLQGADGRRNGLAGMLGIDFKFVHADLDFAGEQFKDIAVRYKGNGTFLQSRASLKRSLKVHLNHYVKGQKLAGETRLNFHNCVTDASWMNEVLSFRLYRDAGVPAASTAYARVYVTVPGLYDRRYFGLYSVVRDMDKDFAKGVLHSRDGALFKPVTPNLFAYLGEDWKKYQQTYDPKTEASDAQKRRVIDFARFVTTAPDDEFAAKLDQYLDLDEFARYIAVTVYLSSLDSILAIGQNYYVYLEPRTQRFQFFPWDLDHSFGQFPLVGSQEQRENLSILKPWRGENRFLDRVFKVEAFKKIYLARMEEFAKTIFRPQRFAAQVDEIAAAIRPAIHEESQIKVARFDKVVAGESVPPLGFGGELDNAGAGGGGGGPGAGGGPGGGGPGPQFSPPGFMQTKPIKSFVLARSRSIAEQLSGASKGQVLEGFGFGGPPRGPGGAGGGNNAFGPGAFLGPAFMRALDANKDGTLTHDEVVSGFDKWFEAWHEGKDGGPLTEQELRAGIDKDLFPFPPGGPGGPGGGPGGGPVIIRFGPGGPPPPTSAPAAKP